MLDNKVIAYSWNIRYKLTKSTFILSMIFLVVFYVLLPLFIYNKKWAWLRSPITKKRKKIPYKSLTADRLNKHDDVDVIIVGSNISALICAALLSRVNIKVLVLEKQTTPGVFFTRFIRDKYSF